MSEKVLVTKSSMDAIGDSIRDRNGLATEYLPSEMPAAIEAIPNSYTISDEGKIVKNGALVAQTARATEITQNGTYDTTENNSVTVNVSGGGGGDVIFVDSKYSTSGSFSYDEVVTIPSSGNYTVYVQMFTNSTHTVKINGTNVSPTTSYSNCYVYLWNFSQSLSAGDTVQITMVSTGSPMIMAVVKRAGVGS